MYELLPGDQVCHVLPQALCISMILVKQEPKISGLNPSHVYRVILSHVGRDQLHVLVLCCLIGIWRCIYGRDLFSASVVVLIIYHP